jgi:uncharacterized protein (DUF2147 family)
MLKYFMPAVLCTALLCLTSLPAMAQSATGYWLTENERSVIYIHPCEGDKDELCGDIHWIIDGGMQYDSENPDPELRDRPLCSLTVLRGFEQQTDKKWTDGKIYKADDGKTYNGVLQLLPTGKMLVRGYVGLPLLGKSQKWTRVEPDTYQHCRPPEQ